MKFSITVDCDANGKYAVWGQLKPDATPGDRARYVDMKNQVERLVKSLAPPEIPFAKHEQEKNHSA